MCFRRRLVNFRRFRSLLETSNVFRHYHCKLQTLNRNLLNLPTYCIFICTLTYYVNFTVTKFESIRTLNLEAA